MVWTPAAALVEDGTGKSTAVVFEQPSTGITWLNSRGKTSFSGATDAQQEQYAQEAVEDLSDIFIDLGFEAPPTQADQALIWPAVGAYRWDGRMWDTDELPAPFLEAVRLTQEEKAAGTWLPSGDTSGIKSDSKDGRTIVYRQNAHTLEANHPEIHRRLRKCMR